MTLRQGLLEPLRRDLVISYDSNLELASNHFHKFDLAPQMTAQFKSTGDLVTGTIVRGYFFQKMQSFELTNICEIPKLFSQLKRVETLFVQPQSDSYYLDLKDQLEKTISTFLPWGTLKPRNGRVIYIVRAKLPRKRSTLMTKR
jgi:hypothetical protein